MLSKEISKDKKRPSASLDDRQRAASAASASASSASGSGFGASTSRERTNNVMDQLNSRLARILHVSVPPVVVPEQPIEAQPERPIEPQPDPPANAVPEHLDETEPQQQTGAEPVQLFEAEPIPALADISTPDNLYFDTYARLRIHEAMLKDKVRTNAYRDAILHNKHLFKDKVILDVGCGTGILSLFAAKAGARRVFAVDYTNIAKLAAKVVEDNRYAHIIHVYHGRIEDVELPVSHVDVIISEWMGYSLLFESMLDSVLFARDKWLPPDGLLFPDYCSLFMAGVSCARLYHNMFQFWPNVWTFDMGSMRPMALAEGRVMLVKPEQVVTNAYLVGTFDLQTVQRCDLSVQKMYRLRMKHDELIHGLCTWFTVEFRASHKPIELTTSPMAPPTHWKQTVFFFGQPMTVKGGEYVYGTFRMGANEVYHRVMDVQIDVRYQGDYATVKWNKLRYRVQ